MGDRREHKSSDSPFLDKSEISGSDSVAADSKPLSQEANKLLAEKQRLIQGSASQTEYPALNAMAARAVYYGLQGRLLPNMNQINKAMLESGPVGEAAVARMRALEGKGWTFGPLSPNDPFIAKQSSSRIGRLAMTGILGGYNDSVSGKIAHNPVMSLYNTVVGISPGADKDAANKYVHELAHGKYSDGYNLYETTASAKERLHALSTQGQIAHGEEMLREEVRALTAQVVANVRMRGDFAVPQNKGYGNYPFESALKNNQLGVVVKDVWQYEGLKPLSTEQARVVAQEYVQSNYGELFKDGKLNPQAERAIAAEISRLPVEAPRDALAVGALGSEAAFSSSRYFSYLSRGGQALGSLAMLTCVADLNTQFKISPGYGTGRLLSVGSDWAGFEGGAAVGGWLGEGLTSTLIKINPKFAIIALPLISIGSGVVSTQIMHGLVSKPLEKSTQETVDELLKK